MQFPASMQPTVARIEQIPPPGSTDDDTSASSAMFPPVPAKVSRNLLVTDVYAETPPAGLSPAVYGTRGGTGSSSAQADFLSSFDGLAAVPDDVAALLPPECRAAFDRAVDGETAWKARWGPERDTMCRRDPIIDKAIVP